MSEDLLLYSYSSLSLSLSASSLCTLVSHVFSPYFTGKAWHRTALCRSVGRQSTVFDDRQASIRSVACLSPRDQGTFRPKSTSTSSTPCPGGRGPGLTVTFDRHRDPERRRRGRGLWLRRSDPPILPGSLESERRRRCVVCTKTRVSTRSSRRWFVRVSECEGVTWVR